MIVFLGSGVSLPTGLPSVGQLTGSILTGEWHLHTDQLFYRGRNNNPAFKDPTSEVQRFLRFLKGLADAGFAKERRDAANYEDLYYICDQLTEHEEGMGRNVSILPFLESIRVSMGQFSIDHRHTTEILSLLHTLAGLSCTLIQSVVRMDLHTAQKPLGLDLVAELAKFPTSTIVTLNHDLLVEKLLTDLSIDYRDGFGKPDGDVRWFDGELLAPGNTTRLLKLHGSVDRFFFYPSKNSSRASGIGIPTHQSPQHCKDADGGFLSVPGNPEFLTGVGNKDGSYNLGVYAEAMFRFHEALKSDRQIVISGYGWGDRGVNARLMDWLYADQSRKLFMLHERPEEFVERQTPLTFRRESLKVREQLIEIRKWLCDTTMDDLVDAGLVMEP